MYIQNLIDNKLEQQVEPPRPHIGCSTLGHPCDRYLWLAFHWAVTPSFPGRMLRLFKRGQDEEASAIKYLTMIGARVHQQQKSVDLGQHVSGSVDGDITGLPGHELAKVLLEIKTHNKKSFNELEKKGVQLAKPMHYTQMQVYMHGLKRDRALYYAVCKDDDRLYTEIVLYDREAAVSAIERGHRIASTQRMPEPIAATGDYYICKMCDMRSFCWETQTTKNVNCRTCMHSTPTDNSTWVCALHHDEPIPYNWQTQGCSSHVLHHDLVPYVHSRNAGSITATLIIDGKPVVNGDRGPNVYSSAEILADPVLCASNDPLVQELRMKMDAKIIAPEG